MKSKTAKPPRKIGRPLSFDRDAALHQAMLLFWRYGYEATSLAQLTEAMGITPPSLYAAFGDKKRLFLEAVERYVSGPVTSEVIIRDAPSAREAVWTLLQGAAIVLTGTDTPPGCMLTSSATNCSISASDVQAALAAIRLKIEAQVRGRIQSDIDAGALPPQTDATSLASLGMAVIQGMSTQARDGADRSKLLAMAKLSMRAWPSDNWRADPDGSLT